LLAPKVMNSKAVPLRTVASVCVLLAACSHGSSNAGGGACARIVGSWQGDGIAADGGQDPEALRVVDEVMREERWRISRVLPNALQRERVGAAGGRAVGEAMYVTRETPTECAVEIRGDQQRTRAVRFTVRSDSQVDVDSSDSWYTLHLRRRH
jgi:hypothetical protein